VAASPDQKRGAARKLLRLYGELGEDPPDSLRAAAGAMSASQADWVASMQHAVAITDPFARKAAVDELVRVYPALDLVADPGDAPVTTPDAAGAAGTSDDATPPADAYAVAFLQQTGPPDGAPNGQPPATALPGPLADLERQRSETEIDTLEADIQRALEG
jgi:hypothetical protein